MMKPYLINASLVIAILFLFTSCSNSDNTNSSNSTDKNTWINVPFTGNDGFGIYSSCTDGTNIYLGTQTAGVFKSSDNGNSWTAINNGVVDKKNCKIHFINNALYLTTVSNNGPINSESKIYRSINQGASWTPVYNNVFTYYSNNISGSSGGIIRNFDMIDNNIYVCFGKHVLKSSDSGMSWQAVFASPNNEYFIKLLKMNNSLFLLSEYGTIYKSIDNGNHFSDVSNTLNTGIRSLIASNGNLILGKQLNYNYADDNGVYVTDENATNWQLINKDFFNPSNSNGLSIRSFYNDNGTIYAGNQDGGLIYKSTNHGINWQQFGSEVEADASIVDIFKCNNLIFVVSSNKLYKCKI